MLVELFLKFPQIPPVIHGLLEFSDEPRSQGVDFDPSVTGGDDEKEMVFR
jgi:hypothetical protein